MKNTDMNDLENLQQTKEDFYAHLEIRGIKLWKNVNMNVTKLMDVFQLEYVREINAIFMINMSLNG